MFRNLNDLVARRAHQDDPKFRSMNWTLWLLSAAREIPECCETQEQCLAAANWLLERGTYVPEDPEFIRAHHVIARFMRWHAARVAGESQTTEDA